MPSRAVKLFVVIVACLGLTAGLAACGGDSDDKSGSIALTELPGDPQAGSTSSGGSGGGSAEAPAEEPPSEDGGAGGANAAGKAIFAQSCSGCHTLADAGASGSVGPNLDDARPDEASVAAKVRAGGGGMPSFSGTLEPGQIDAVAAYVSAAAGS